MIVSALKAADIERIELPSHAQPWSAYGTAQLAACYEAHGGYAVRDADRIIALGGVVSASADVGIAWSMLSRYSGPYMLRLHRIARRALDASLKARILASTECDFAAGCRWLELLGFQRDKPAPGLGEDGRDHHFYVRVS